MNINLKQSANFEHVKLQSIIDVNTALNSMIKQSYKTLFDIQKKNVPELVIYAKEFKDGSFIQDLVVKAVESGPQLAFAAAQINISDALVLFKNSIKYLQFLVNNKENGHSIRVEKIENSIVYNIINTGTLQVGDKVIENAAKMHSSGDQFLRPLKNGDLESITLSQNKEILSLSEKDANLFQNAVEIDEEVKSTIGNITEFNKMNKKGKFEFIEEMTSKKYRFSLSSDSITLTTIDSMKSNSCKLVYHEEYIMGADDKKVITSLVVLKILPIS